MHFRLKSGRFISGAFIAHGRPMRRIYIALLLSLALVAAQQGQALHALSHLHGVSGRPSWSASNAAAESICPLCLAFAQLGHLVSAHVAIPAAISVRLQALPESTFSLLASTAPTPRSRGPPALV